MPPVVVKHCAAGRGDWRFFHPLVISAMFNETMNPATITTSTFTLAASGGILVAVARSSTQDLLLQPLLTHRSAPSTVYTAMI